MNKLDKDNYIGCLLGGAIGDALGAPTEFMTLDEIIDKFGENGVVNYVEYPDNIGRFTDDTQMTLFTAEGILRSINRHIQYGIGGGYKNIVHNSYLRWLHTQQDQSGKYPPSILRGWLLEHELLFKWRAPGNTCLRSLNSGEVGTIDKPINDSKGCGGVMRVAPVGLLAVNPERAFELGVEFAAMTHGHPSGYLSAGAFASIIAFLNENSTLENSISETLKILSKYDNNEETTNAIQKAVDLFKKKQPSFKNVELLGGGWVGEEALSIALY